MRRVFHRLMKVLAGSTRDDLRGQVQFLKAENEILRSRLSERGRTTPRERTRLIKLGRPLGSAIKELITIVSPKTFLKWVSQGARKLHSPRYGGDRADAPSPASRSAASSCGSPARPTGTARASWAS